MTTIANIISGQSENLFHFFTAMSMA